MTAAEGAADAHDAGLQALYCLLMAAAHDAGFEAVCRWWQPKRWLMLMMLALRLVTAVDAAQEVADAMMLA